MIVKFQFIPVPNLIYGAFSLFLSCISKRMKIYSTFRYSLFVGSLLLVHYKLIGLGGSLRQTNIKVKTAQGCGW